MNPFTDQVGVTDNPTYLPADDLMDDYIYSTPKKTTGQKSSAQFVHAGTIIKYQSISNSKHVSLATSCDSFVTSHNSCDRPSISSGDSAPSLSAENSKVANGHALTGAGKTPSQATSPREGGTIMNSNASVDLGGIAEIRLRSGSASVNSSKAEYEQQEKV